MGTVKGADAAHSAKTQFLEVIWRLSRQQNKQQPFDSIFFSRWSTLINNKQYVILCVLMHSIFTYVCVIFIPSSM